MKLRGGKVLMAAAVVAVLVAGKAAPAPYQSPPLLNEVNHVRAELGLTPLRFDPVVRRVVLRMARNDLADRTPEWLEAQPDCAVCDRYYERGVAADPRALYRSLGGRRSVRFGLWRAGWSATDNLSVFFPAAGLVLDPRARTLAFAQTPLGMLVVGVTADVDARFSRPVRWPPGRMDPRRQLWVEVVLPPGYGYPNLYDVRDGLDVTVAYPLAAARGFRGSRVVAFGLNTSLAYDKAYHVGTYELGVRLRTKIVPADFMRRSWTFHSVSNAERAAFLDTVRRAPAQLRALLTELDGAVDVVGGSEACLSVDACEDVHGERATVGMAVTASREVILHELGHVVFDLALDERGRRAFRSAFIRTGWRNAPYVPPSEQFADQVEHWALGEESADPRWLPPGEISELLRAHASYRPRSAVGLLSR